MILGLLAVALCAGHAEAVWPEVWTCDGACRRFRADDKTELYRCVHGDCPTAPCPNVTPPLICPIAPLNPWTKVATLRTAPGWTDPDGTVYPPFLPSWWPFLRAQANPTPGVLYDYTAVVYDAAGRLLATGNVFSCEHEPFKCYAAGVEVPCH